MNVSLDWLLVFVPIAVVLRYTQPESQTLIFLVACLAILPLAGCLGRATEHLAAHTGEGVGGLLNATFGNAAEMIIAPAALQKGLHDVVKASLTGSIIGNVLPVLGASIVGGGVKHRSQRFQGVAARSQAAILTLVAIALVMPAAFHHLVTGAARIRENDLSLAIAIVLLVTYALSLVFTLHTHKQLFSGE
jgi:Ca2+:H+ antiporter